MCGSGAYGPKIAKSDGEICMAGHFVVIADLFLPTRCIKGVNSSP